MTTRSKFGIGLSAVAVLALFAIPFYQPLKFHYAIWRIESASTPAQEKSACILAGRVGSVWEINEIAPNEFRSRVFASRVRPEKNDIVTEIEWWESPWWKGMEQPYRAYRVFLDPENRQYLVAKPR